MKINHRSLGSCAICNTGEVGQEFEVEFEFEFEVEVAVEVDVMITT